MMRRLALAALAASLGACLERGDAEQPGYSVHVLARGARVPKVEDDEALAMRFVNNAGASGPLVPLQAGFVAGAVVWYWDFGVAPSSTEPVWILQRGQGEAAEPIEHPPIVDSLPGDDAYSPFRAVFTVAVTDAYDGELIPSLAALEDAIAIGLVEEPQATGTYVSWPIVPAGFELERRDEEPLGTRPIFGAGVSARYIPLSAPQPFERSVATKTVYTLRRQDETAPLEEGALGADLNEDGDQLDSNLIFEAGVDAAPSGLWSQSELVVASDYVFGTYRAVGDLYTASEMAPPAPVPGAFIERSDGEELVFRPLYAMEAP